MGDNQGIDNTDLLEGSSSWFLTEAVCDMDSLEELFDTSTDDGSIVSQLIDDEPVAQGNSLALYNEQLNDACEAAVTALKRKLIQSPQQTVAADLSPKLAAIVISPQRTSKRRLFDSGIEEDEAENSNEKVALDTLEKETVEKDMVCDNDTNYTLSDVSVTALLKSNNVRACLLAKFKELYGVSFNDLTRQFKSDKTCSTQWVVSVYRAADEVIEGSKQILQQYCEYIQLINYGNAALYLLQFQATKNRSTVVKLMSKMLNINDALIMCEPPRTRSTPVAMYFYKKTLGNACTVYGTTPEWIEALTTINHQMASTAETFDFSMMVQWAYDNEVTSEAACAYGYAMLAAEDTNAAAFLKSNCQVRYVKDCVAMVKYYKRHEMSEMTMNQWIVKCCNECADTDNWRVIADFLNYQGITLISFLTALKLCFKSVPKKNTLLFYGEPDTGKSYFCSSLVKFLKGKVVSFMNRHSTFWLQPLLDAKIGYLDDATYQAWQFIDVNMRTALDGTPISIDAKHKAPVQLKLPPLLITSNWDVMNDNSLKYLHSRLTAFKFSNKMPFDDQNNIVYNITDATWRSFFTRLAVHLELKEDFENGAEIIGRTLRCTAGTNSQPL